MGMSREIVQTLHDMDKGGSKTHCKEPYCMLEEHDTSEAHYDNLHDLQWLTFEKKRRAKK